MKKFLKAGVALGFTLLVTAFAGQTAFAKVGDIGFFGGITEGTRLPKTTETLLQDSGKATTSAQTVPYKEVVFLGGIPVEFSGTLTVRNNGEVTDKDDYGTYKATYTVNKGDTSPEDVNIARTITFNVNWRRDGKQIVKDYTVASWSETITVPEGSFKIDPKQSHFDISILEDHSAGVVYYKGDISQKAVYSGDANTTYEASGSLYGYDCVWSNTETQRIDAKIYNNDWQMYYQIRPSVSVNKTLQYSQNEPTAISFEGNYREVMQNKSGLQYNISVLPKMFYGTELSGSANIGTYNAFEQLIAPDLSFLKGNNAEADIKKLFAMGILEGPTNFYKPTQAITRGQWVTMLSKAIKLPVDLAYQTTSKSKTKKPAVNIVFPDVLPERPDFPYIMAAYKAGLAVGRGSGHFHVDQPIEREEAYTILLRTIGLSNLGLEPTAVTPYVDDAQISSWAKKEIYAATRIGLISGDEQGKLKPKEYISKAEAAALVNRLIEYMRTDLQTDYTEHIVNYAN